MNVPSAKSFGRSPLLQAAVKAKLASMPRAHSISALNQRTMQRDMARQAMYNAVQSSTRKAGRGKAGAI